MAYDFPDNPSNGDIIQTANKRFQYNTTLTRWEYEGEALLNAGATIVVPGSNTWGDVATSLTAAGCVELSLDNSTWTTNISVTNGGTFYTRWNTGVSCLGAAHGTTITGTITDDATGADETYTLTIDRVPAAISLSSATASAEPSSVTPVTSFTVSDITTTTYLWGALTTDSGGTAPSNAQYSLDGVSYASLPTAAGTVSVSDGATVYLRFTAGNTTNTTDTLTVRAGESVAQSVSAAYTVTVAKAAFTPTSPTAPTKADLTSTCITWDAGADTIYATGCLEFNKNGGAYTQASTAVANGNTICVRWKDGTGVGTTCADSLCGATITGTIQSATKIYNGSLTIDRQPNSFTFSDQTGAALSTVVTSNTVTLGGMNSEGYLQATAGANALTSIKASINGGAYAAIPAAGTYTLAVKSGDTVQLRATTGASVSTTYSVIVSVGDSVCSQNDTWAVTTTAAVPTVTAPTITSPSSGATNITKTNPSFTSSAYVALNGAGAHNTSDWQLASDASFTNIVASSTASSTNKTTWTPTVSLSYSTTYYVRVQHNSVDPIASGYGASSSFTTKAAPVAGDSYGGGYYGGQINVGGTIYNLVVAPVTSGSLQGQYGGSTPSTIQWKTSGSGPDTTAQSEEYGATAMLANSTATWPMFNWVVSGATGPNAGTYDATNALGTGIGGYNDWYIPAKNELEILYRNLKPTTNANNTSSGANANAVGGATSNYTAGSPAQTTVAIFQSGGSQAFSTAGYYWSASEYSSNTGLAWRQYFSDGSQYSGNKLNGYYARAVRRVAA